MTLRKDGDSSEYFDPGIGAHVRIFDSEKDMLLAWLQLIRECDPDAIIVFQVACNLNLAKQYMS